MKFLGTIIDYKNENTLVLTDFPTGIISIATNAIIKIGFNQSYSADYTCISGKMNRKRFEIILKQKFDQSFSSSVIEQGVFIDENLMVFKEEAGFFISDLIDCSVFDYSSHELIGKIIDVYILPANDVWIVATLNGELPVPVIDDVVKNVNIKKKIVEINIIDGLMDLISGSKDE